MRCFLTVLLAIYIFVWMIAILQQTSNLVGFQNLVKDNIVNQASSTNPGSNRHKNTILSHGLGNFTGQFLGCDSICNTQIIELEQRFLGECSLYITLLRHIVCNFNSYSKR